jgi:hypothetical protein
MEARAYGGGYPEKKGREKAKLISALSIIFNLRMNHRFWYCLYLSFHHINKTMLIQIRVWIILMKMSFPDLFGIEILNFRLTEITQF